MSGELQLSFVQVLLLLALWDLGHGEFSGQKVPKTEVKKRVSKAKSADFNALLESMEFVELDGKENRKECVRLTDAGKAALSVALAGDQYSFTTNTGAKTVNALLRWIQVMGSTGATAPVAQTSIASIESYEAFKAEVLETCARLKQELQKSYLVPIYRVRRALGERIGRDQFDEWLFEMQNDDILILVEEEVEDNAIDKLRDSVVNVLGNRCCYIRLN